ncbi:hypothetical protein ES708_34781 [subsurface metagenome]
MTFFIFQDTPKPDIILSEMPREKAIEILGEYLHSNDTFISPDVKIAITMAMCSLIAEVLDT